jgi:hypothetical protein
MNFYPLRGNDISFLFIEFNVAISLLNVLHFVLLEDSQAGQNMLV